MAIQPHDLTQRTEKGIRLFKLRANSRWYSHNQEGFAHQIGYHGAKAASNISRIENGDRALPAHKEEVAAKVLAADPDLVNDWEYLLGFLRVEHADLRGCLAAHPRFSLVGQDEANPGNAILYCRLTPFHQGFRGLPRTNRSTKLHFASRKSCSA